MVADYLAVSLPMDGQDVLVPQGPGLGCTLDEARIAGDPRLDLAV
jgi:hypothetical protein